jgi:hypothetical protein
VYKIVENINLLPDNKVKQRTGNDGPDGGADIKLYSFFNLGCRWKWEVNATPWPLYPRGRPRTHKKEVARWAPLSIWMENFISTRIRSLDHPAHSEPLY